MTSLAFLKFGTKTLLLAGEGPLLHIYEQSTRRCLLSDRVFDSQALHGICTESTTDRACNQDHSARVLIWGGPSVCLLAVENSPGHENQYQIRTRQIVRETQAEDWIFDACFSHVAADGPLYTSTTRVCKAVIVTAHNTLLSLNLQAGSDNVIEAFLSLECIAAGPRSTLYSAHVVWTQNERCLVAAGTVFGEVLLWSFPRDQSSFVSDRVSLGQLHCTFTGHEGSIFGVRISEEIAASDAVIPRRVLASCSDDRTIRIWDISHLELDASENKIRELSSEQNVRHSSDTARGEGNSCLVTVSGHSSRIWGVRFLYRSRNAWQLMSYGEDSTAQIWQLGFSSPAHKSGKKFNSQELCLRHQYTYAFHSGKNIWAVATCSESNNAFILSTGGADGRITSYYLKAEDMLWDSDSWSGQWSIQDAYMSAEAAVDLNRMVSVVPVSKCVSSKKALFQGLQGKWLLRRNIKSAISTYPSGFFEGIAVLKAREPTDEAYDLEFLYSESGKFTAGQGFVMKATRRYVYRFQEKSNRITAWFVCPKDQSVVDYLFHVMDFEPLGRDLESVKDDSMTKLCAIGHHLCIDDDYQARYEFHMRDATLTQWDLTYIVKGPNKDYVADARYVLDCSLQHSTVIAEAGKSTDRISKTRNTPIKSASLKSGSLMPDSFKGYAWVNEDCFITSTERGKLLVGTLSKRKEFSNGHNYTGSNLPTVTWEKRGQLNELESSCIMASTRSGETTVLCGNGGMIYMYQRYEQIYPVAKIAGKVVCLSAQTISSSSHHLSQEENKVPFTIAIFASCLGSSTAHALTIGHKRLSPIDNQNFSEGRKTIEIVQTVLLDLPAKLVATSSFFVDSQNLLVLGSRSGRLTIYDLLAHKSSPVTCTYISENIHGHGEDAITSIELVPTATSGPFSEDLYILTTGRDGRFSVHQIFVKRVDQKEAYISLQTVHTCAPPFGPNIEGTRFVEGSNDLLLWGFRSKHFVVWNETQKTEVMTVNCGGASRNWAYSPRIDGSGGGSFVWTKASICKVQSQAQASHEVVQHGGHGREIKTMAISPLLIGESGHSIRYIATGAEDTAIRIFSHDAGYTPDRDKSFKCLGIFTNHKTGIQQVKWSPDGNYLFSAAGLEEFLIWRVRSVPCIGVGMFCEAQFPPVTESCDLRIMDFDIIEVDYENGENEGPTRHEYVLSLVYSDSSVRVRYRYQILLLTPADSPRSTITIPQTRYNPLQLSRPGHTLPPV